MHIQINSPTINGCDWTIIWYPLCSWMSSWTSDFLGRIEGVTRRNMSYPPGPSFFQTVTSTFDWFLSTTNETGLYWSTQHNNMLIIWIRTIRDTHRMLFSNKLCFEISLWSYWSSEFVTVPLICLKEIRGTTVDVDPVPVGGFRFVPEGSMGTSELDLKPILGTGSRFILDRYLVLLLFDFLFLYYVVGFLEIHS